MPEKWTVALLTESVDRNTQGIDIRLVNEASLSSRRAWIEMDSACIHLGSTLVALLTESVDRNHTHAIDRIACKVALLTESVDRNTAVCLAVPLPAGRSPHGERG